MQHFLNTTENILPYVSKWSSKCAKVSLEKWLNVIKGENLHIILDYIFKSTIKVECYETKPI